MTPEQHKCVTAVEMVKLARIFIIASPSFGRQIVSEFKTESEDDCLSAKLSFPPLSFLHVMTVQGSLRELFSGKALSFSICTETREACVYVMPWIPPWISRSGASPALAYFSSQVWVAVISTLGLTRRPCMWRSSEVVVHDGVRRITDGWRQSSH